MLDFGRSPNEFCYLYEINARDRGLEAVWQAAHQISLTAGRYTLVAIKAALLLSGLLVKMVPHPRRTTNQLSRSSQLEALGYRFLSLLHDF
jgi:hypothetical protein